MGNLVKRKSGKPSKKIAKTAPSAVKESEDVSVGQRGRRAMPAVKTARKNFSVALRKAGVLEKSIHQRQADLVVADRNVAAKIRSQLKVEKAQLKLAKKDLAIVVGQLRQVLAKETAKSRAQAQQRAIAIYKSQLHDKFDKDLEKALASYSSAWKKKRSKIISRKLKARVKKEASKAVAARRRANAKAKASVKRAEVLAKARARKAAAKARAKAKKLAAKTKAKTRMVVRKAKKAQPVAVTAGRVSRKKRSK